jgi:hypothetical protein
MEGVWGMLFQAFEYDIDLRLELQFSIENHLVFLKTFLHDGFVQLASEFKNFHEFIN